MTISQTTHAIWLSHQWGPSAPAYGGGTPIKVLPVRQMAHGDTANSLMFEAGNHIGTHMDAPRHFIERGRSVDTYEPLELCFFQPLLVDVTINISRPFITVQDIQNALAAAPERMATLDLLLLRTGAESYRQHPDFWQKGPGIDLGVADYLRQHAPKCRAVGLDSISITSFTDRDRGRKVHREFLGGESPFIIFEDMKLEAAPKQTLAMVVVAPLRIEQGDGAPITVMGFCHS